MPYIAIVRGKDRADSELDAYRYGPVGTTDIDVPAFTPGARIRVWVANTTNTAQNQADRLSSGMFGARVCETETDLAKTLEEWQA